MNDIHSINVENLKYDIINNQNNQVNFPEIREDLIASSTIFKEPLNEKILQLLIEEINENQENFNLGKVGQDNNSDPSKYVLETVRNSFVYFLPYTHWIHGIVWDYVLKANREIWNYDITHVQSLQITKYGPGQFYNWHVDFSQNKNHPDYFRKLSVTIQLNDPSEYEGGCLELFDYYGKKIITERRKGSVCVFDSRTRHRVTKVKSGTRYSLVAWICGPALK
jgi:PKHD-type hydroxylase